MYRDRDEELQRLQAELLQEEEPETEEISEDLLDEDALDALMSDPAQSEGPRVYQNFSNNYGKNLRNYASGYRAYNSDSTEVDLDDYSEEVREPKKSGGLLTLAVILLILAIVAVGVFIWLYLGGLFLWR